MHSLLSFFRRLAAVERLVNRLSRQPPGVPAVPGGSPTRPARQPWPPGEILPQFFLKLGGGTPCGGWLGHAIEPPAIERSRVVFAPAVVSEVDHDDRKRLLGKQRIQSGQTVHIRHLHVERDHVRPKGFGLRQACRPSPAMPTTIMSEGLDRRAQHLAHHYQSSTTKTRICC